MCRAIQRLDCQLTRHTTNLVQDLPGTNRTEPVIHIALPLAHSTGAVLISLKYYKKLPNDLAKILSATFPKAMADLTAALRAQNDEALQLIQKSGLTLIPASRYR